MRKVFSYFQKKKIMIKNKIIIPIIFAIIVITAISLATFQQSDMNEIEETFDVEAIPQEETKLEIQEKLDEIEKNVEESKNIETDYDSTRQREWLTSGPFQIDRSEYALGENIFLRMNELSPSEKGQVVFLRPLNSTYYSVYITIPFDGVKPSFNQYFTPDLSKLQGICSVEDISGEWTVVFAGTDYENIKFTVSDKIIVPGQEPRYEPVC
jgi:hypothetical protein